MDIKALYRELADLARKGKQLCDELDPEKGLTPRHHAWGECCKTIIAAIDPHGAIFDQSTPVGMFYDGWNTATFEWPDRDERSRKRLTVEGFAKAYGALEGILKAQPKPREPPPPETQARGSPQHPSETGAVSFFGRFSGRDTIGEGDETLVVLKLKSDASDRTRENLRRLATAGGESRIEFERSGPLERVLHDIRRIEPLFPDRQGRAAFREGGEISLPSPEDELGGLNILYFNEPEKARAAVGELDGDEQRVEYAHLIPPRFLFGKAKPVQPADPLRNRQWGIAAIELELARKLPQFPHKAKPTAVAVIDSGVDVTHPDLRHMFRSRRSGAALPPEFRPQLNPDRVGHGTHVIGIIGAACNNKVGITGVCEKVNLLSLKALGPYDGPTYYRALRYATDNAKVINLSLGGAWDPTEELLIKRALREGVVVVAAMGNDFQRGNPISFPAAIPKVIAVGASDELDEWGPFSQTGDHISLAAPGVNILSTVPRRSSPPTTDYAVWSGTSMATAFVTATVALLVAQNPSATVDQIHRALRLGADRKGGKPFNKVRGYGRLNARKSL